MAENGIKYDPKLGKNTVTTDGCLRGIATETWACGPARESYNPRTGRFELVDSLGRTVGYVPKNWRD